MYTYAHMIDALLRSVETTTMSIIYLFFSAKEFSYYKRFVGKFVGNTC